MNRLVTILLALGLSSCRSFVEEPFAFLVFNGSEESCLFDEVVRVDKKGNPYYNKKMSCPQGLEVLYDDADSTPKVLCLYRARGENEIFLTYKNLPGKTDTVVFYNCNCDDPLRSGAFYQGKRFSGWVGVPNHYYIDWKKDSVHK